MLLCLIVLGLFVQGQSLGEHLADTASEHHGELERRSKTVFQDDFSSGRVDDRKWTRWVNAQGGGNEEFEMYVPEKTNSYVKNGVLYIRPTLTADRFGEAFLSNGVLDMKAQYGYCSGKSHSSCHSEGWNHIKPIMSAKLVSKASIRYGKVEVVAKLPKGDWLWPAIWMVPTEDHYGVWPRSGEIDIMESRGNTHYLWLPERWTMGVDVDYVHIHYGPHAHTGHKGPGTQLTLHDARFCDDYHKFWMDWTKDYIKIGVDDHTIKTFNTPSQGYWHEGHFQGDNIWANGGKDAPFDRPFKLILNVAVGGVWFRENYHNSPYPQPWHDSYANKSMEFWVNRHLWLPTWHGEDVAMKIKSVKMVQY